jgi:hypothetical protein
MKRTLSKTLSLVKNLAPQITQLVEIFKILIVMLFMGYPVQIVSQKLLYYIRLCILFVIFESFKMNTKSKPSDDSLSRDEIVLPKENFLSKTAVDRGFLMTYHG